MKIFKNSMIGAVTLALAFIATPAMADDHAVSTAGEISFGYGLSSSAGSLVEWGNDLTIDYWLDDSMAIGGGLNINHAAQSVGDVDTSSTDIGLHVGVTYVLAAGAKTRFTVGGGLSVATAMSDDGDDNDDNDVDHPMTIAIPAGLSIEHFVWDSVSIGVNHSMELFKTTSQGDDSSMWINLDTTNVGLELTWYTD